MKIDGRPLRITPEFQSKILSTRIDKANQSSAKICVPFNSALYLYRYLDIDTTPQEAQEETAAKKTFSRIFLKSHREDHNGCVADWACSSSLAQTLVPI